MDGERVSRIRLRSTPDTAALVVRGDELDPTLLAEDASRFHERFSDGGRFGISEFEADGDAEIDVICQTRLVRFATVIVFERAHSSAPASTSSNVPPAARHVLP